MLPSVPFILYLFPILFNYKSQSAYAEVMNSSKKDLERELQNENRPQSIHRIDYSQQSQTSQREEEI